MLHVTYIFILELFVGGKELKQFVWQESWL